MAPAKVMLIRHAEKPDGTGNVMGVSESAGPTPGSFPYAAGSGLERSYASLLRPVVISPMVSRHLRPSLPASLMVRQTACAHSVR